MYIKTLFYLSGWITGQVLLTPLYIFIYISEFSTIRMRDFKIIKNNLGCKYYPL